MKAPSEGGHGADETPHVLLDVAGPLGARAAALHIDRPALWLAERCHLRARIRLRRPSTDGAAGGATPEATISRLGRSGVAR